MAARSPLAHLELPCPLVVRLPMWMAKAFSLKRWLAQSLAISWREIWPLVEAFEHSGPERRFAQDLLRQQSQFWVYRCHQRAFCGDFLVVDMSPPKGQCRPAYVVELKSSGPLRIGGGGAGNQFKNSAAALESVQEQLPNRGPLRMQLVAGDGKDVLHYLRR